MKVFHHKEGAIGRIEAEVMDGDNVRVGELADQPGLALEAPVELRLDAQIGIDELDADFAVESSIESAINRGHAAPAAPFEELVAVADRDRQRDVARRPTRDGR